MNWQQASKLQELTKSIPNLVETISSIQIAQGMHTPKYQLAHLLSNPSTPTFAAQCPPRVPWYGTLGLATKSFPPPQGCHTNNRASVIMRLIPPIRSQHALWFSSCKGRMVSIIIQE